MESSQRNKKVLCPLQSRQGKTYWLRIGNAYVNSDGSTNVWLDAYPANGKLQIRDLDDGDFKRRTATAEQDNSDENNLPF